MNVTLLQEKVKNSKIKKSAFAEALGCTYKTLQKRFSGEKCFSAGEICTIAEILHLNRKEVMDIFFDNIAHK